MSDKRIDTIDGVAYTLDEMKAFYAGEYTKKDIVAYWNTCEPAKGKPKAKAKIKVKAKKDLNAGKRKPMDGEEVLKKLSGKVVPVIKVNDADHSIPLVTALLAGGVDIAEITFRTACAAEAIKRAATVEGVCVGAGTVLQPKQVDEAVDAGADFIISPGFSEPVWRRCERRGVIYIPAVITPTEVMTAASKYGLKTLKFFPAGNFGGAATLKSYGAVFPDIKFMPTGGVTEANIGDFLSQPNIIAAGGTWFVADADVKKAVESGDWGPMTEAAKKAKAAADAAKK